MASAVAVKPQRLQLKVGQDAVQGGAVGAAPTRVEAAGARTLLAGDVAPLGKDIIHSVTNPLGRPTGAIHVYGGDFFAQPRSEWDEENLAERPYNIDRIKSFFAS